MLLLIQQGANNPILRKKSELVADIKSPEIQRLILNMKETLQKVQGLGLAAPQVGENLRIFVINKGLLDENEGPPRAFISQIMGKKLPAVYINPGILKLSKERELMEEGCLSLPGIWGQIERHKWIEIEARDERDKKIKIKAKGLLAQVFQHEIDHLEGVLFVDKAVKVAKKSLSEPQETI